MYQSFSSTRSFAMTAFTLLAFAGDSMSFWRMGCRSRTGLLRIDPLVSPGQISEHIHAIHGSSGFSETATYQELMSGQCTSCEVAEDKSAYWHPALYFHDSTTGKFSLVPQVGGMLAYYLLNPNPGNTTISSFPAGFQMIAGDTNQRNFTYPVPDVEKSLWSQPPYNSQAFLRQAALGFNCLNYNVAPEPSLYRHYLPDKGFLDANCPQGVRFELMFPSCWNGQKEIPPNKMDHMAYPSMVMSGECPKEYPERLPSLFYEIIWDTYSFKDKSGEFVIANGDTTGCGFHGDFIMGWDEEFLRKAVNTCTNLSGKVSDCPMFTIQDSSVVESCNLSSVPSSAADDEKNIVNLDTLPGNVRIQRGPGYAIGEVPGQKNKPQNLPESGNTSAAKKEKASNKNAEPAAPIPPPPQPASPSPEAVKPDVVKPAAVTPAPEANIASAPEEEPNDHFSIEYKTNGNEVLKIYWVKELATKTVIDYHDVYVTPSVMKRSHLLNHRRHNKHGLVA